MRPLSFENLRRLVSRKKDRNEPSFKRSESFKRISIRKSYLDRGKRRNKLQKNLEPVITAQPVVVVSAPATTSVPDQQEKTQPTRIKIKEQEIRRQQENVSLSRESISYDEWLQGVGSSSREKLQEKLLVQEQTGKSSTKVTTKLIQDRRSSNDLTDDLNSAILSLKPFGPNTNDEDGWIYSEKNIHQHDNPGQTREPACVPLETGPPSVSISLGRVWRDAVPVPYPSSSGPSVHHSLDSALKERKPSQPTVARTVSAPEKTIVKDNASSSSSFGFSLRIGKLADFRAGSTRNGFFRRKTSKPSPSVSTEGYFKRTSGQRRSSSRRRGKRTTSSQRTTSQRTSQRTKKKNDQQPTVRENSPVWFVPPERRRSRRQRRVWREIRYFPEEKEDDEEEAAATAALVIEKYDDYSSNLSDDQFDDQKLLLSGDFNERRDEAFNSLVSSSLGSFSVTSSSSSVCPAPKISDFNEDKLFSEELRNRGLLGGRTIWKNTSPFVTTENYFTSSQFINFLAKSSSSDRNAKERSRKDSNSYYRYLSSSESDNESSRRDLLDDDRLSQRQQHLKRQKSGPRRRPLRRKSQLRRASGQPVFLVRKCSSLRKRPSKTAHHHNHHHHHHQHHHRHHRHHNNLL